MNDWKKEATGESTAPAHGFEVRERAHIEVHGMTEVISFDENAVMLATTQGNMTIEGRELRVNVLNVKEGQVSVDGHVDGIYYTETTPTPSRGGFLGKLLH